MYLQIVFVEHDKSFLLFFTFLITKLLVSSYPLYDSFPPSTSVIEVADINIALNNLSFSGFASLGYFDSNGHSSNNVLFGTQAWVSSNTITDSEFFGSTQSSNDVFSNYHL